MNFENRRAVSALAAAGALWGLTVPLSKLSLVWLGPAWLTVMRLILSAPPLAAIGRHGLRRAATPGIVAAGTLGFGAVIVLQNAGIERTSVTHAAVIVGAVPVLVALMSAALGQATRRPLTWAGYAVALAGIGLVAGGSGSGATPTGDLMVLASVVLSAAFIALQPRILEDRDVAAVTAVEFAAGALVALPIALLTEGAPAAPSVAGPLLAFLALAAVGTALPFWLFAYGQARVSAPLAGIFVNLEPVVGAALGWVAFGDTAATGQIVGAIAVLAGIGLSALPPMDVEDRRRFLRARRARTA